MRKQILLSSLSVGRCFRLVPTEDDSGSASDGKAIRTGMTLMSAEAAWKITGTASDSFDAVSASGAAASFTAKTIVVEVPRQGYDRLVERSQP